MMITIVKMMQITGARNKNSKIASPGQRPSNLTQKTTTSHKRTERSYTAFYNDPEGVKLDRKECRVTACQKSHVYF
jgi:hypothetical protein